MSIDVAFFFCAHEHTLPVTDTHEHTLPVTDTHEHTLPVTDMLTHFDTNARSL